MTEDPIRHESPGALGLVRSHVSLPLAAGERYHSKWEFQEIIDRQCVDYVRPDVCHCGGITEMRKIAAMAEAKCIHVVPHSNSRPSDIVTPLPTVEAGYALPLDRPGLGVEFNEEAARARGFVARPTPKINDPDGSVRDR